MKIDHLGLHLHQSDIETFQQCPEKARLTHIVSDDSHFESDAATVGTCMHAVIEHDINEKPFNTLEEALNYGAWHYVKLLEGYVANGKTVYSRETFKTDKRAIASLDVLVRGWWESPEREMLLMYDPDDLKVEYSFDLPFTTLEIGGEQLPIWLAGTADLVFPGNVWDWKSASGEYVPWERKRWAIQPTVYLWAAAREGLILPDSEGLYRFTYKVMVRRATPQPFQSVEVFRSENNFVWLEQTVLNMARMMATMGYADAWPLNDHSALCSPKWCPFWDGCKGRFVDKETWT